MRLPLLVATLTTCVLVWALTGLGGVKRGPIPDETESSPIPAPVSTAPPLQATPLNVSSAAHRLEIAALRAKLRWEHRHLVAARRLLAHRWRPTVRYALELAAAVSGVPRYELEAVARCESGLSPFARNGRYLGLFQLGWTPFGLSPYDPIANALSAALTVQRDGGWRQWQCKP